MPQNAVVLAVSRFRYDDTPVPGELGATPYADLERCLEVLSRCPGYVRGAVGRAIDDPPLWVLQSTWESVGAYRRALSSYDAKLALLPLAARTLDEPSAFEIVVGEGATPPNEPLPRGTVT
jgi:hypothetical protein